MTDEFAMCSHQKFTAYCPDCQTPEPAQDLDDDYWHNLYEQENHR